MKRNRSQALVIRNKKILMIKQQNSIQSYYCLPGGGIKHNETPEEACLRELEEEANVKGKIIRLMSIIKRPNNIGDDYTFLVEIPEYSIPKVGIDPEMEKQLIKGVAFLSLNEISEKDRAFLFASGIQYEKEYREEVLSWDDAISYPVEKIN